MAQGIFIGIGGSGVKSLARLKAKIYESYTDKELFNKENSFIFIDTDFGDIQKIQTDPILTRMYGNRQIIGMNEFIPIGNTIPSNVRRQAIAVKTKSGEHLKTWMIMPGEGGYKPLEQSLQKGAGAQRLDGRTSLFQYVETDIIPKIETAINKMQQFDNDFGGGAIASTNFNISTGDQIKDEENAAKAPNLWLISGSNGGTGSSMTLDILFVLNRLYFRAFNQSPTLRLALLTPEPYVSISENKPITQYPLNSFAFMWELNAFKIDYLDNGNNSTTAMAKLFVNDYFDKPQFNAQPFNPYAYALVFDTEAKSGVGKLSLPDTFENVSKVLFMLCRTKAGSLVNSNMINVLADPHARLSEPNIKGNVLEGSKWSKSLVATGGKAIVKADEFLKNYIKARFNYDIYTYGILGAGMIEIYNDAERQVIVNDFIRNNIEVVYNMASQNNEKPNLETDIRNNFNGICLPAAPEKRLGRGLEGGILLSYSSGYCDELNILISTINETFNKKEQIIFSKEYYLDSSKSALNVALNSYVCEFGLNFIKDLIHIVDMKLEGFLKDFKAELVNKYSNESEKFLKEDINSIANANKDYNSLLMACEKWRDFKVEKFIVEKKIQIIESLCHNGYLDELKDDSGIGKGIVSLIKKYNNESLIHEGRMKRLSKEFFTKSNENPFVTYLPQLEQMVGVDGSNDGWKKGSEFEELYKDLVTLNPNEKNIKGSNLMGTPPKRNNDTNDKSLKNHIEYILEAMNYFKGKNYFIDFATQNDFDRDALTISSFQDAIDKHLNELIIKPNKVKEWISDRNLGQIFSGIEKDTPKDADDFCKSFNSIPVFYPTNETVSSVYYIYTFPDTLLPLANKIGFDSNDPKKKWEKTTDANKLEVLAFEMGHSFDNYKYMNEYVYKYDEHRKGILELGYGCHIHKGFIHLNINKTIGLIDKDIKPKLVEIAFYDAVLEKLSAEKPQLFEILIKTDSGSTQSGVLARLKAANSVKLPMVTIMPTHNSSQIKILNLKKNDSKKYELATSGMIEDNLENFDCFSEFVRLSKSKNADIESLIQNLRDAFNIKKDSIKGVIFDLIATNSNQWVDLTLTKLKVEENKFNDTLDMDYINNEFIPQINELISNNLFKN